MGEWVREGGLFAILIRVIRDDLSKKRNLVRTLGDKG